MSKWKKLPKVELHCHLEGTLRFATLLEEAKRHGIILPSSDEAELRRYFLIEHQVADLPHCLEIMDRQGVILADKQTIVRMAREAVVDKCEDGVKLIEFRYAPSYIQSAGQSGLSFTAIHQAVKEGLKEGQNLCISQGEDIEVGLICIGLPPLGRKSVEETVEFLLNNNEMKLTDYQDLIDEVHEAGINITLHSGEERSDQSVENVKDAIQILHAKRIGHGVNIFRKPEVYQLVKSTQTHLELCPISNVRTNAVDDICKHPIKSYLDDALNVSVNTDDPGPFAFNSNDQYDLLHKTFKFGLTEFFTLARNALASSFLPEEARNRVFKRFFSQSAEDNFLNSLITGSN